MWMAEISLRRNQENAMKSTIQPDERRAIAVVTVLTLLSFGMLGLIIPAPHAADRSVEGPTPYSAMHAAIPDSAVQELPPQF